MNLFFLQETAITFVSAEVQKEGEMHLDHRVKLLGFRSFHDTDLHFENNVKQAFKCSFTSKHSVKLQPKIIQYFKLIPTLTIRKPKWERQNSRLTCWHNELRLNRWWLTTSGYFVIIGLGQPSFSLIIRCLSVFPWIVKLKDLIFETKKNSCGNPLVFI